MATSDEVADKLRDLWLHPELGDEIAVPEAGSEIDLKDRYRGSFTWGATGDALGRPGEGRPVSVVRERYGRLTDFIKWSGWQSGPVGTITDDTQLPMCMAEAIIDRGRIDPEDLARRFVEWLPIGRGKGRATVEAIENLGKGQPWYQGGVNPAGNGAAMRAAPVGLRHPMNVGDLCLDAVASAIPTHNNPMAASSAAVVAGGVALCVLTESGKLNPESFIGFVISTGRCVADPGAWERKPQESRAKVRLADRISQVLDHLDDSVDDAFDFFWNDAFVIESLPAAIWCFLRYLDDPEEALIVAASQGRDSDTVASMAGNFAGAYHGLSALPERWRSDLEYFNELCNLADALLDLSHLEPEELAAQ